ncbi:MAG: electron transfer flavoprotein subunit beta/FixA family protein [Deltaproteobacteria bacterium]|nr:electron transfer flavoprotein subunit beta/FixA family protein [Deltaproteobacteria bacterium]
MKILVCVKQISDTDDIVRIDASRAWIEYHEKTSFRMNRYDEYALEEALRIREKYPETSIDAISLGPARAVSTIRKALEMGADNGIHLLAEQNSFISPSEIATLIATVAKPKGYSLILAGVMAEDDMFCQTGQLVAAMLGLPCATSVIYQERFENGKTLYVEREIEGGQRECLHIDLPAVLTIQSGINRPRYPSLSNVLRARKQEILRLNIKDLRQPEPCECLACLSYPQTQLKGEFIQGSLENKARTLLRVLHQKALL